MTTVYLNDLKMKNMYDNMKKNLPILQLSRDEWVKKMMKWHFSEETGSPFWLNKKKHLPFNPLTDIKSYDDLNKFGLFNKSDLKYIAVKDLIPKGFENEKRKIFETGGTTGDPIRIIDITTGTYNVIMYRTMLEARNLLGGDIVAMTPSGPHAYGNFVSQLGKTWNANVFFVDFDPRWVKKLIRINKYDDEYVKHIIEQTIQLLESQSPKFLFTTSKLLLELTSYLNKSLYDYGVRAVCTGGTSCTAEEKRYLEENFLDGIQWIDTFGNTLMGHALQGDPWSENNCKSYYLPPPLGNIHIVDPNDWQKEVSINQRGQVLLITLLEDLFIPNLLERDSAINVGPHPWFPWNGVSSVRPFKKNINDIITEGVY